MPSDRELASLRISARWAYRELRRATDGQLTKSELCDIMACDRSTVNRAVNELQRTGAVEVVRDPADHRVYHVRLR